MLSSDSASLGKLSNFWKVCYCKCRRVLGGNVWVNNILLGNCHFLLSQIYDFGPEKVKL